MLSSAAAGCVLLVGASACCWYMLVSHAIIVLLLLDAAAGVHLVPRAAVPQHVCRRLPDLSSVPCRGTLQPKSFHLSTASAAPSMYMHTSHRQTKHQHLTVLVGLHTVSSRQHNIPTFQCDNRFVQCGKLFSQHWTVPAGSYTVGNGYARL